MILSHFTGRIRAAQEERFSQELASCGRLETSMQGIRRDRLGHLLLHLSTWRSNTKVDGYFLVIYGLCDMYFHFYFFLLQNLVTSRDHDTFVTTQNLVQYPR